jgi:hypothetical protein
MGFAFIMDSNGNSLDIHCCNKYSPSHSAKVSEKPIGNGNTTSDMRTLENLKISLDCIISNTPSFYANDDEIKVKPKSGFFNAIDQLINGNTTSNSTIEVKENDENDYISEGRKYLEELNKSKEVFSLFLSDREEIKDLVLTKFDYDETEETGNSFQFKLEMKQLIFVKSKTTKMPKAKEKPKVEKKQDTGKNDVKKAPEEKKSAVTKIYESGKEGVKKAANIFGGAL